VVLGLWALPKVTSIINTQDMASFNAVLLSQAAIVVLLTLPVTIIFGAWLPLLNKQLGYSGLGGARLYGVNSIGAALGTVLAGFVFIPLIGTYAVIVLAALSLVFFSIAWVEKQRSIIYLLVVFLASIPVLQMVPVKQLLPHRHANSVDLYFHEDALNITHVIGQQDGQRILLADLQRMDASSDPASVHSQRNQGRLPLLLHSNPQSVLFLGMGTGISMSASLGYANLQRTAVELSGGAIEAADKWFSAVNNNIGSSSKIIRDDARRFLKTGTSTYDVIIGDLFHPDLVGRSALLSRQQFLRAKNRLSEQGIFVQWIALNQFDKQSLDIVLRTFKNIFPDAVIFLDAFRLALVGINGQLSDLTTLEKKLSRLNSDQRYLVSGDESIHTWLGRYWGKINVDEDGEIQDEWNPKIEFRLPQARYNGELDLVVLLHELLQRRPHVSAALQELAIDSDNKTRFERAYIGTELAHRSWLALLQKKNSEGHRLLRLAYQANPKDRWIGMAVADASLENYDLTKPDDVSEVTVLQSILKIRPDHANALKRLWVNYEKTGDNEKALEYKNRFEKLSPYDKSLEN
jgi:spermidine synthase